MITAAGESMQLSPPYLIFLGDEPNPAIAKTAFGLVQWVPQLVAGQLRFKGNALDLGVPDLTLTQAAEAGVKSLVIGVAPVGGVVGPDWIKVLVDAATLGMDIVSGLHLHLQDFPELLAAANHSGAVLTNVRTPSPNMPIGTGEKRSGKRLLMVGTDCAVGKKYTALAIAQTLTDQGLNATFRATGQTGIMIAGTGVPIDAVVSDFVAGAAEIISPNNQPDHWDVIEGQGSLFNPAYAGVSLGLLHGSQPDAIVLCHDATRDTIIACPETPIPPIANCIDLNLRCGRLTNAAIRCIGVSVNTSGLPQAERQDYLTALANELSLPCFDPIIDGCESLLPAVQSISKSI